MKRLALSTVLCFFFTFPALAQVSSDVQQGLIPFGSYQQGDVDSVNLMNGNVMMRIPLVSYPQRGGKLNLNFSLIANNKGWFVWKSGTSYLWKWQNAPGQTGTPSPVPTSVIYIAGPDQGIGYYQTVLKVTDYAQEQYYMRIWNLVTNDNAIHEVVPISSKNGDGLTPVLGKTIDATGIYFNVTTATGTTIDANGIQGVPGSVFSMIDPNGNEITSTSSAYTDTLGRVIPTPPGASASTAYCPSGTVSANSWTVPAYNGGSATFKFCYANVSIQTAFHASGVIESSGTATLLNAVVLPNLQKWQFGYDSYGSLTSIVYPTGGSITYVWANATWGNASRMVTSRTLNANDGTGTHTTTYQWYVLMSGNYYNIVTDPASNDTVNKITGCPDGRICQSQYYSGSHSTGTLLKTVTSQFHSEYDPYSAFTGSNAAANVVLFSQTTTWPGGKTSQTTTSYDAGFTYQMWDPNTDGADLLNGYYGKPVLQTFSDYGSGGVPGSIIRQNSTAYQWQSDSNYLSENLLNLVKTSKVLDGSGNTCAETDYAYDDSSRLSSANITEQHIAAPGSKRGNVSSVTQQLTSTPCQAGASWRGIPSYVNAYDTGTTYQTIDPLGHTTTYTYSPTFYGAYPTQVQLNNTTTPGASGSVTHISTANYDFNTGIKTSATDENSRTASFALDNMWRLTQTSLPDGGALTFSYQDTSPFGVTVTRKITATQNQITKGIVDGVGRLSQTQLTDPNCTVGSGLVKADFSHTEDTTLHDRLTKTSTPYCDSPGTIYGLMTVNHSDTIGRLKSVVETDGSTVTTTYSDNLTTVSDEAGKQRKSQVDGLGRLTAVWEDPGTSNYETDYSYDPVGNLLTVNQKGTAPTDSTQWRTRTFTYDSLSRLLSTYNPESGTTSYTYNDDGTLATKTTPKQNQTSPSVTVTTTFAYDEIHRLESKTYSDGTTPTVKYVYDGVSLSGCTPSGLTDSNPKPNRTSMCDAAGASAWSHDVMSRILSDQRTNSGVTKTTSYTYNLNGSLATLTYASGRMITYSYSAAARPISAVDVADSINYATAASYTPPGALASLQNGSSIVSTMYFNKRLQPCRISVKYSGTAPASCTDTAIGNVLDFTYNFNLAAGDNGNVLKITNNRDTTRSINYSYDNLNRIYTAYTDGNLWGETFQIDAWANLNKILAYTGKPQSENLNQAAGPNNRFLGMSYDAAGNLLSDGVHSFVYDAENRITTGAAVTYQYDGDGRRVYKSSGTLYWYGTGSDPLNETDLSGVITNATFKEYVFFSGTRIARRDSTNAVSYYFADHLGTARIVANSSGSVLDDSDFYPYGGERVVTSSSGNRYKFTGKERDAESGLDNFGARYYANTMGRFMSPDWAAQPTAIPYAQFGNPQSLNLYIYVGNNPMLHFDPDGHCWPPSACAEWVMSKVNQAQTWVQNKAIASGSPSLAAAATFTSGVTRDVVNGTANLFTVGKASGAVWDSGNSTQRALAAVEDAGKAGGLALLGVAAAGAVVPGGQQSTVLSGHGMYDPANGIVTVPSGTTVTLPTGLGNSISDAYGGAIESGANLAPFTSEMTGSMSYLSGSDMPNLTLYPPDGLTIMGNPTTVTTPTNLDQLLQPNMGNVEWAACCSLKTE